VQHTLAAHKKADPGADTAAEIHLSEKFLKLVPDSRTIPIAQESFHPVRCHSIQSRLTAATARGELINQPGPDRGFDGIFYQSQKNAPQQWPHNAYTLS